jgi:GTP cyclohydrolase I
MPRPTKQDAMNAIKTIIEYIGEDPTREGLIETPSRVVKSYDEFFSGYKTDIKAILSKKFTEIDKYNDIVLVKDIDFVSHCEHHMLKIIGKVNIAYIPDNHVLGLSKLARVVDAFAKRLQNQERLTSQIAHAIYNDLRPKGVYVNINAHHDCISIRGISKQNSTTKTNCSLGYFEEEEWINKLNQLLNS